MPGPGFQCPLSKQDFPHLAVPTRSNTGDLGSIPGLGRSRGEGKGYPLQYSGLENYSPWSHRQSDTAERLSLSPGAWATGWPGRPLAGALCIQPSSLQSHISSCSPVTSTWGHARCLTASYTYSACCGLPHAAVRQTLLNAGRHPAHGPWAVSTAGQMAWAVEPSVTGFTALSSSSPVTLMANWVTLAFRPSVEWRALSQGHLHSPPALGPN